MADLIQFNCPACGTMLQLPLAMSAHQGPCPNCDRQIAAPDPYEGIGAFEIPVPPPPEEIEPFRPFAEPVVDQEPEEEPEVAPEPVVVRVPVCEKPHRTILVLSCLLSAWFALAVGYGLGVRSNQYFARIPPLTTPMIPPPKVEKPEVVPEIPAPPPVPLKVKPMIEVPKIEPKPEPGKVSAAAEASLRAFLEAPDWAARSAYVLFPEKVRSSMEAYSREAPDGPTAFQTISVKQSHIDEATGNTLFIFYVKTEKFPGGIPVAVKETAGGWLVDWQTFVEFRDDLFQKFVDGPADSTGNFHLAVTLPPPARAASTENEHFSSYLLQSPLSKTPQIAFVRKSSEAFTTFQEATAGGGIFTPVVEVVKRKTREGQSYFEVLKVVATDWLPREN